jgi:glucokinase
VSGTSIAERALEALAERAEPSSLRGLASVTAEAVAVAARNGDALGAAGWDDTVEALACGLTSIVNLFEPERIVLGGGVTSTGEQLLGPVRERMHDAAMTPAGKGTAIVRSALGDHVGVVGAATIVDERDGTGRHGSE